MYILGIVRNVHITAEADLQMYCAKTYVSTREFPILFAHRKQITKMVTLIDFLLLALA